MTAVNGFVAEYDKSLLQVWVDENGVVHIKVSNDIYIVTLLVKGRHLQKLKHYVNETITSDKMVDFSINVVPSDGCVLISNNERDFNNKRTKLVDSFYLGLRSFNSCPFVVSLVVWNKFINDVEAITGLIEPFVPEPIRMWPDSRHLTPLKKVAND